MAACHFAEQVHSGEMKPQFQATSADTELMIPESEFTSDDEGGVMPVLEIPRTLSRTSPVMTGTDVGIAPPPASAVRARLIEVETS